MQEFDALASKVFCPTNRGGTVPKLGMYLAENGDLCFSIAGVLMFRIDASGAIIPTNLAALVVALKAYYAVEPPAPTIVTAGVTTVMGASQYEVIIKKGVSGAHAVTLPPAPVPGQIARVQDGKGDLNIGVNNITIVSSDGSLINGAASVVMDAAWSCTSFRWIGTQWLIVY